MATKQKSHKLTSPATLRASNCAQVDAQPGWYRWWMRKDKYDQLIAGPLAITGMPETISIDGDTYVAVYFGISKDLKQRMRWHICQKHTASQIKVGTISTFRRTLSALLRIPLSQSEQAVNDHLDNYMQVEWFYATNGKSPEQIETKELQDNLYPLNIDKNPNVDTSLLKAKRKEINC